jgi:hypothetical protein
MAEQARRQAGLGAAAVPGQVWRCKRGGGGGVGVSVASGFGRGDDAGRRRCGATTGE